MRNNKAILNLKRVRKLKQGVTLFKVYQRSGHIKGKHVTFLVSGMCMSKPFCTSSGFLAVKVKSGTGVIDNWFLGDMNIGAHHNKHQLFFSRKKAKSRVDLLVSMGYKDETYHYGIQY